MQQAAAAAAVTKGNTSPPPPPVQRLPQRTAAETITAADGITVGAAVACDHDLRHPYYCEENVWRLAHRKLRPPCGTTGSSSSGAATTTAPASSARRSATPPDEELFRVVFISNRRKAVPMLFQRASRAPESIACCWDYHVVLLGIQSSSPPTTRRRTRTQDTADEGDDGATIVGRFGSSSNNNKKVVMVYDVDTTLTPYPIALSDYLDATFGGGNRRSGDEPLFRVVPASVYLKHFASDRRHMYNAATGTWTAPPPPYQCIGGNHNTTTTTTEGNPSCHNLPLYVDFTDDDRDRGGNEGSDVPADALGTVLTLEQLRSYAF
jgi:N-terminal glutamine amidase